MVYVVVKTNTCSAIAQLQLTVTQTPNTTITQSAPAICGNTPVVLTSNYAVGNVWSNGSTNQNITVTTPGTYTVTTTNGACSGNTATITLVATPDPNIQITGNLNFCQGSSTTLTATANGNSNVFSWSNGTNGATALITTPGTYTVTVTTPSGCQFQKSVTVTMDPQIVIQIAPPGQIDCNQAQVSLNASNSVFVAGSTILWTTSGGGNIVSGANTLNPVVNAAGTYILSITSPNANGCSAQGNVVVIKNMTPTIISVSASSIKICRGQSVILTATGGVTYTWTGLTGNGNTQSVSPTTTTTYTVTGVGSNGCIATTPATVTITVVPEIVSTLQNGNMCKGDALTLDAGSGPNYTYLWNTGETTQTINVTLAGNYTVVINNGTCTKSVTAIVTYTVVPEIKEVKFENHTLTIVATNTQGTPMEFSMDNGVTWQGSNVFTGVPNNMYFTIAVRNVGMACYNSVQYFTVFITNIITPNFDGVNDTISFSELAKYENFGGSIYDRYGKIIFKLNKTNYIWNGQYLNLPLPTASYWYELHWKDPISLKLIEKSGWILLKNRD
jgi:gliding motility-associated-like protein